MAWFFESTTVTLIQISKLPGGIWGHWKSCDLQIVASGSIPGAP
jgi:hypothetical protein